MITEAARYRQALFSSAEIRGRVRKLGRNEFHEGRIEVGENVPAEALDIFDLDIADYIIPKQEKKVKCPSDYNDHLTFIDTE